MRIDLKILSATFMAAYSVNAFASGAKPNPYDALWEFAAAFDGVKCETLAPPSPVQNFLKTRLCEDLLQSFSKKEAKGAKRFLENLEGAAPRFFAFFESNPYFKSIMDLFAEKTVLKKNFMTTLLETDVDDVISLFSFIGRTPKFMEILNSPSVLSSECYNIIHTCLSIPEEHLNIFIDGLYTEVQSMTKSSPVEVMMIKLIAALPGKPEHNLERIEELKEAFSEVKNQKLSYSLQNNRHFKHIVRGIQKESGTQKDLEEGFYSVCLDVGTEDMAVFLEQLDRILKFKEILRLPHVRSLEFYNVIKACMNIYSKDHKLLVDFVDHLHTQLTRPEIDSVQGIIDEVMAGLEDEDSEEDAPDAPDDDTKDSEEDEKRPSSPKKPRTSSESD